MAQGDTIHIDRMENPDMFRVYTSDGLIIKGRTAFPDYEDALQMGRRLLDQFGDRYGEIRVNWVSPQEEARGWEEDGEWIRQAQQ